MTLDPNANMVGFFRALGGQVCVGLVGMDEAVFLDLVGGSFDLVPEDAPDLAGQTLLGRLYVPGRRHCLLYGNGDETSERGWKWITPEVWPEGDECLRRWEALRDQALAKGAPVLDLNTGRRIAAVDEVTGAAQSRPGPSPRGRQSKRR